VPANINGLRQVSFEFVDDQGWAGADVGFEAFPIGRR